MDYWQECIIESFGRVGITASLPQIKHVAEDMAAAHDTYGFATGVTIPHPLVLENEKLLKELDTEKRKRACDKCDGTGIKFIGSDRYSNETCVKCRGMGVI